MKTIHIIIISFLYLMISLSCGKPAGHTPEPDNVTPVDSEVLIREYYLSNRTDLFILYANGKEHKADSALFLIKNLLGHPKTDHLVAHFRHSHDLERYGCLNILVEDLEENVGTPHIATQYEEMCDDLRTFSISSGGGVTVTKISDSLISGYFQYNRIYAAFNNVPILR